MVDANIVLSALIRGRARLVIAHPRAPRLRGPHHVRAEVLEHLPRLAQRRGLDLAELLAALAVMPIEWVAEDDYAHTRGEAQRRMARRDPDDWPVVALALVLDLPIWSQDKDFEVAGITVYTTGQLLDTLRELDADIDRSGSA